MAVGGFAFEEAPMNAPQYGCEWRNVKVQQKGKQPAVTSLLIHA
jgi:hypothetical protein